MGWIEKNDLGQIRHIKEKTLFGFVSGTNLGYLNEEKGSGERG